MKKATLNGKTSQTLDNSITPAATVGATAAKRPSVKKYRLKPNPLSATGVALATRVFIGDHKALLKNE